jgi:hypothetical protein
MANAALKLEPTDDEPRERTIRARRDRRVLAHMLRGLRFRMCRDGQDFPRAVAVRRSVYAKEMRVPFPIPDRYDSWSWTIIAEDVATHEVVGTIRVTPRAGEPLEAEERFQLPEEYRTADTAEITRFAVLPTARGRKGAMPVVFIGLVKAAILFMQQIGTRHLVVKATSDRAWAYQWFNLKDTGLRAPYPGLGNELAMLLACDFQEALAELRRSHRLGTFLLDIDTPEIEKTVPSRDAVSDENAAVSRTA